MAQPCVEKIFINLNAPIQFNLRHKILGDQNANLQYIINETNAKVTLRGRGSGFIDPNLGIESQEPLHLYIEHPVLKSLIEAKNLSRNLLETIQTDLQMFVQSNPVSQAIPIQQPPPIMQQANNQPITIPSTVLSVPPPNIIQSNSIQPTHIIQQQNFIPQSQIIPQQMQIIQQTPINIPPPTGIRTAATTPISVQFQGQPANIQIQPTGAQQILVNQTPTQQYQLQYIPAANQITNSPQAQTIQHFIQPQQQIQGILQPNGQQFITVQGNTYMLPPPNIVQNPTQVFNAPPLTIPVSQSDDMNKASIDLSKVKQDEQKSNNMQQQMAAAARTIVTNINQPPPPIQQFIVNANSWPQTQMPLNSQIQIVTQPQQTIRNGNEIVIQNSIPSAQGQQVITTFNPQQGPPLQQIQFSNQSILTQPPPLPQIPPPQLQIQHIQNLQGTTSEQQQRVNQALSYQQQFEQKINMMGENSNQQRAMKRKIDDAEADANKSFPKTGMGSMNKNRPPPPIANQLNNQHMTKMNSPGTRNMLTKANVNTSCAGTSGDNMSINNNKNNSNKSVFNKNNSTTSLTTKMNVTQADTKQAMKSENENFLELPPPPPSQQNFDLQNQSFMVRPLNQILRFNGPHNFIHHQQHQPPPSIQFNQLREQMIMYQNQPPPPPSSIQDMNSFQNSNNNNSNNNFAATQQVINVNRFNVPRGNMMMMMPMASGNVGSDSGNMISGSGNFQQQQQPRFRQQW